MSEYQYYEFVAVDRPLTRVQMAKLRSYSTRARITPTRFANAYHWGDLKGNPRKWMEEFFDGHLYLANWGTRNLYLRLPATLLDLAAVGPFLAGERFEAWEAHGNLILSFSHDSENGGYEDDYEWDDDDYNDHDYGGYEEDGAEDDYGADHCGASGSLGALLQLRGELVRGDLRALYLGWLLGVAWGVMDPDEQEPPVPPGLCADELTVPQRELARFLKIAPDLIAAAAEKSASLKKDDDVMRQEAEALRAWLAALPTEKKDAWLLRVAGATDGGEGEPVAVASGIRRAFLEARRAQAAAAGATDANGPATAGRRTVGELRRRSEALAEARRKREAEAAAREKARREHEAAAAREKHLDWLAGREHELWPAVHAHIATRLPKEYDQAVALLRDLRDLARRRGESEGAAFESRLREFRNEQARKPSLIARIDKAFPAPRPSA